MCARVDSQCLENFAYDIIPVLLKKSQIIFAMEKASKFGVYRILWQIKFFAPLDTPWVLKMDSEGIFEAFFLG